jgi:hypothetical protein
VDPRREAKRAAALGDEALLAQCRLETFVAGGPGGQHRNKAATGVRLRHPATGLAATATERRSQAQNRREALLRLRRRLEALAHVPAPRLPTRPTPASGRRRLAAKRRRGEAKARRRKAPLTLE